MVAPSAFSAPQKTPAGELKAAAAAEKAGQFLQAVDAYQDFLKMGGTSANPKASIEVRVRIATDLFMAHRYQDSLQSLRSVLPAGRNPASGAVPSQAWVVAGLDSLQLNHLNDAIRSLRLALESNPASGTARLALGDALARSGHLDEAAAEYRDQARRTPKEVEAWYKLGVAEGQLAKQTFHRFTTRHPDDPVAGLLTAEQALERGDGIAAAKILLRQEVKASSDRDRGTQRAIATSPILPGAHADLGQAFLEEGYTHAADNEFQKELAADPESLPAWFGLAETESLDSQWESALSRIHHLMVTDAPGFELRLEAQPVAALRAAWQKGRLLMPAQLSQTAEGRLWHTWLEGNGLTGVRIESAQQDTCPALPIREASAQGLWLTQACYARLADKLDGELSRYHHLSYAELGKLAEADDRLGRYDDARTRSEQLLRDHPQSGWGVYWLIHAEESLAAQSLLQAASLNPNSVRVYELLARMHADHYQWKRAIAEYQRALHLAPNLTSLYFDLGEACWQAGDWVGAQAALRKTLEIFPTSAVAAYELGDTDVNLRQWAEAVPYLTRALADSRVQTQARLDRAKAESELGHNRQALADLIRLQNSDSDGEIHFRLAMLYRKMGDLESARRALAESQKLRQSADRMTVERTRQTEQERARLQQAAKQESHR
jgi:tetratricopeptide (TPR) repeat protein